MAVDTHPRKVACEAVRVSEKTTFVGEEFHTSQCLPYIRSQPGLRQIPQH